MTRSPLLPAVCALWLTGCSQAPPDKKAPAAADAVSVSTIAVATETWPSTYEATGTVRARTSSAIAARMTGYIRAVNVQAGDHVRQGQLLVTIDARELDIESRRARAAREEIRTAQAAADSAIAGAKASLDLAQITYGRMQDLFQKKSISNQEFDEASAKLKGARAAYEMETARRAQLNSQIAEADQAVDSSDLARTYAEIRAPFAGLVIARSAEPGSLAMPGNPLLTIEREGEYRLEALVEESQLPSVRPGEPVSVTLDGIDRPIAARVSEIVSSVDASSRAYTVKIDLPAIPQLRSGAFGRAEFQSGSRSTLAIPETAVTARGQLQSVLVADSGVARTRLITLGARWKDRVEVLSGLSAGDDVIFPIPPGLADGARIEVRP